jgi:hypothetical protein
LQTLIGVNPQNDAVEIALRARSVGALFNPLDPSPLAERDLDPAV